MWLSLTQSQKGMADHGTASDLTLLSGLADFLHEGEMSQIRGDLCDGGAEASDGVGNETIDLSGATRGLVSKRRGTNCVVRLTMSVLRSENC
jgi:hypothetical protein